MRSPKQGPMRQGSPDDFQTPPIALKALTPYLNENWTVWECAEGKGYLSQSLRNNGFKVIGTDILTGHDFLTYEPNEYDCIVTNPPYSIKQEFLERCYELKKPFALLLPLTTFETNKRQLLFRKYGIQVIFLPKRVNFMTPSGNGSGSWFATAWFTYGLNLERDLIFYPKLLYEE